MKKTIILAPLQGFTDWVYRTAYCRHFSGLDSAVAPFISTMGEGRLKPSRIKDVLPENNLNLAITPQILGNIPEDFLFLASHLTEMGYQSVNWNLGCPHSKIAKKQRGSGLLSFPEKIDRFLDRVIPEMKGSVSVKVRLGRYNKEEIMDLLPVFNRYHLKEIIVHPRTGIQMYCGSADPDAFDEISRNTCHTLVYNGDIVSKRAFLKMKERFAGVDRFMIGRGVLSNPFLPSEIKGEVQTHDNDIPRIKAFHDDLFESYCSIFKGPAHLVGRMKGHWSYLGMSFGNNRKSLKRIFKARTKEQYLKEVDRFFGDDPQFNPPEQPVSG